MQIGQRLRELRTDRNLSQGDIEERTGLLRCYVSRVEHGHTVPNVETLEKWAGALEIPLYRIFHDGKGSPENLKLTEANATWGERGKESRELQVFAKALSRLDDRRRALLLEMAQQMARRKRPK
jgi:transcriptional regulator with XRE-family HTH domain